MDRSTGPDGASTYTPQTGGDPRFRTEAHERLLNIKLAATLLGVHAWALSRAVKRGTVPSYQGFNSRRLVRLSEVQAAIDATRTGGVR